MDSIARMIARWNALSRSTRAVAAAAALVACIVAAAVVALEHPVQTPLFAAPLHSEQLAEVEEQLAAWNVPFTPNGDNVEVNAGRRDRLLLRLSLADVPHQHLSSTDEALANVGVLTPQSVVDAQTRAGLAGDIEAGLRGIDGVDDATVIVAPAKPAEFADGTAHDASASVRLRLRTGSALPRAAVAGIRAFVAASVPELRADRVTILDDRGVALGDDTAHADDAADLQRPLQSALDTVFGVGAAIVRVRAEYDAQQSSEREVRRTPVGGAPVVRARRSEAYDGGGKRYRRLEEGEDRGSDTRELTSQVAPGALKRLSTAVFVDTSRAPDLAKVRELAAAAMGYDARRGDTLVVEAVEFHRDLPPRRDVWWLLYGTVVPLVPVLVAAIAAVLCTRLALPPAVALLRSLLERGIVERAMKAAAGFPPARVRSMLEQEPPHAAAAIISALPAATATAVLELYPPHEREAIVTRMQRPQSPLLDDPHELLRRHV